MCLTCFETYKGGYSTEFMSERENKRATWKDPGHPNFYHWKLIQRTLLAEPRELWQNLKSHSGLHTVPSGPRRRHQNREIN